MVKRTPAARIKLAEPLLPDLIRMARQVHGRKILSTVAVLEAWAGLAGVLGWTPEMVDRVEREMGKR
jgi:hypothetical protein